MKNWIYIAVASLALSGQTVLARDLNYNVISLNETVSQDLERDTMEVRLMIQEENVDPVQLANLVTQKTNQVLAHIKKEKDLDVTLTNRNSYQTSRKNPNSTKKINYFWREQTTISVKSKNFARVNKLIASVRDTARVQGITFSVSKEKLKSVEANLTKETIKQFRKRATMIAQDLGGRGYKIVSMNIGSTGGASPVIYRNSPMLQKRADGMTEDMVIPDDAAGNYELTFAVSGSIEVLGL